MARRRRVEEPTAADLGDEWRSTWMRRFASVTSPEGHPVHEEMRRVLAVKSLEAVLAAHGLLRPAEQLMKGLVEMRARTKRKEQHG